MLIKITYIDTEYSKKGQAKLDNSFSKEKTEEQIQEEQIRRLTDPDYEPEEHPQLITIEFDDDDFITHERKGLLNINEISHAFENKEGHTAITKLDGTQIFIKESTDYLHERI